MKLSFPLKLATAATVSVSAVAPFQAANAVEFDEFAVDQSQFVAVAVPFNFRQYKLAIIEQIPGERSCWSESGSSPTTVDLSLLEFDHTNTCRKAIDTNGYSLRYNGKDDKVEYTLNLVSRDGQLQLIADHQDPGQQDLVIGRTSGITEAPMKIELDPEWQFTKRLYEGGAIQHIYMSNNPNPQYLENVATLDMTNLPGGDDAPENKPQPIGEEQPQAVATQSEPAETPATTLEGLITNVLTPLSQALYDSYNSLFTSTSTPQETPSER